MADSEGSSAQRQPRPSAASAAEPAVRRRVRIQEEVEQEEIPPTEQPHDRWADAGDAAEDDGDVAHRSRRRKKRRELEQIHFKMVNDRVVDDITMDLFYKPHTIILLLAVCAFSLYKAIWDSNNASTDWNVYFGAKWTLGLFLIVAALAFPTGPFIRPHPVVWRISFGLSVAYALVLQFTVFQSFADVKKVLSWLDPDGLSNEELVEKEYAVNCSDLTLERMWSHMDIFAFAHFSGWVMKALLIRHGVLCWYISIIWEFTEMVFTYLLPNFAECWWDSIILDVLLCNGLGIWVGLKCCDYFQMRTFYWESIKDIETTRGKVKRAVLQFTPENFTQYDWFNESALRRTGALTVFCLIFLLVELNTFFVKHIFAVDTSHPVVFWRLILIGAISAPSIRQFYVYATDPLCKRLGMQSWVFCAVTALESAVCIKFGRHMFPPMQLGLILGWMLVVVVGTVITLRVSIWWRVGATSGTSEEQIGGQTRHLYVDSSYENLGLIHEDVRERRKQLRVASESEYTSDN